LPALTHERDFDRHRPLIGQEQTRARAGSTTFAVPVRLMFHFTPEEIAGTSA
jgi:hypothetical protein